MDFPTQLLVRQAPGPAAPTYDFTENNGPQILAVAGFLMGFGMLVVLLRVYVRIFMTKTMGADDYIMIVAQVSFGGCCDVLLRPVLSTQRKSSVFGLGARTRTMDEDLG
jgi:hypothetical protein